ncbi:MAG: hypothetical protein LBM02_10145 [Lachnospiraceae bacterium]|jgi:hypothetical protein|nr:hypothetical protein [Lachnospiraceae bacterium]
MGEKTCVVNRDNNGEVVSVLVRNPDNNPVSNMIDIAVIRNNGNTLDKAPNGKDSVLFKSFVDAGYNYNDAITEVSKVYSDDFLSKFGDWLNPNDSNVSKVVDENGQPKVVWSGQTEDISDYLGFDTIFDDSGSKRFDNSAFFLENKKTADSYAMPMVMTREQAAKYKIPYREAVPVYLDIKSFREVPENSYKIIPDIEEKGIDDIDGYVGGTIHGAEGKTWSVKNGSQVILPNNIDISIKPDDIRYSYNTGQRPNAIGQYTFNDIIERLKKSINADVIFYNSSNINNIIRESGVDPLKLDPAKFMGLHGSPVSFDRFSNDALKDSHLLYGHGHYFALDGTIAYSYTGNGKGYIYKAEFPKDIKLLDLSKPYSDTDLLKIKNYLKEDPTLHKIMIDKISNQKEVALGIIDYISRIYQESGLTEPEANVKVSELNNKLFGYKGNIAKVRNTIDDSTTVVIYDSSDINITDKNKIYPLDLLKEQTEVYGFVTPDRKVAINTDMFNANTPIHEFAHLWWTLAPSGFKKQITKYLKSTGALDELRFPYNRLTDEQKADEVFVRYVASRGEELYHLGDEAKPKNKTVIQKIAAYIKDFFKKIVNAFTGQNISEETFREMVDTAAKDLLFGEKGRTAKGANDDNYRADSKNKELTRIKEEAIKNGTFMKAPNGVNTNLNEEQWLKVRTEAFKNWFGDWENNPENSSKIIDENREPKVVYHGSAISDITEFDNVFGRRGIFFTDNLKVAEDYRENSKGKIYPVFLNARDVADYDVEGKMYFQLDTDIDDWVIDEKNEGRDGVIFRNIIDPKDSVTNKKGIPAATDYIVFESNQIKSVDNIGTFDANSNDIRFSVNEKPEFINSKVYEYLKTLPFVTSEMALDMYKNIYSSDMDYWKNPDGASDLKLNPRTKEPQVYFRSESGKVYDTILSAMRNSSTGYEIGFKTKDGEFKTVGSVPIYNNTADIKSKVQDFIKQGMLKPYTDGDNVYEAEDSIAAEMIESNLILNKPFDYVREGNFFRFISGEDNNDNTEDITLEERFEKLKKLLGSADAIKIITNSVYLDKLNGTPTKKDVIYDKSQLYQFLENFMKKVGISVTSIDNYKKIYNAKNGIEPDAEAFVDIWNKIIAFKDGKITLDGLSEEVSHFIIEAWDQNEIRRLLQYISNTSYYTQYAETYRNIYSKQNSDPEVVEEYVRREILGKMLSESLQKDFTTENKSEVERNIFQRLMDIIKRFFGFISNKVGKSEKSEIDFFTSQIRDLLYNEQLAENLTNLDPKSDVEIMYSISEEAMNDSKKADDYTKGDNDNLKDAAIIFKESFLKAKSLLDELRKYDKNANIPLSLRVNIKVLIDKRDSLEMLKAVAIKNNAGKDLIDMMNDTLNTIGELSGMLKVLENVDVESFTESLFDDLGINSQTLRDDLKESVINSMMNTQKDINLITKLFGHVGKISNVFITLMSGIVKKVYNDSTMDTNADFKKYVERLVPYQNLINKFKKGGNFISSVDSDKIEIAKKTYEYEIRKSINDEVITDLSLEDFLKDYDNIGKIEKGTSNYYRYDYFYKKNYAKNEWAEIDRIPYYDMFISNMELIEGVEKLENGIGELYIYLKNLSDSRSKTANNSTARKQNNEFWVRDRRQKSNIFNRDGSLKKGLIFESYGKLKSKIESGEIKPENIVSVNPKLKLNNIADSDYIVVKGDVDADGLLAFNLLKWNSLNLSEVKDKDLIRENFGKEYQNKKKQWNKLEEGERGVAALNWVLDNLQFDMSDEYWEAFANNTGLNIDRLLKVAHKRDITDITRLEDDIRKNRQQRSNILKMYKKVNDIREIDADIISSDDKLLLETLDNEYSNLRNELTPYFEEYNIDIYKSGDSDSIISMNKSFYDIFEKTIGIRYENSTLAQKKQFFSGNDGMSADKYSIFLSFSKKLLSGKSNNSSDIERYRTLAKDPNNNDSILEAYLEANAPIWYKRYDVNTEYGNFLRDIDDGVVNIEDIIDDYLRTGKFMYNGKEMDMMQISPSFRYAMDIGKSTEELYEDYQAETDLMAKYELLLQMARYDKLKNVKTENIDWILKNPENLKVYIGMMDIHLRNLENNSALKPSNIFLRPQMRKESLERYEQFVKKGNKKEQVIDALKERFQYREDDFEDSYKSYTIPKYGIYRIDPEELTDNVFGSLIWSNSQSNLYKNRVLNYEKALKAMTALEQQKFKGKQAKETNSYSVMKEMLDYNFYGKTTTMKMETTILGQKIDLAKVLMAFRNTAIGQALGFGPIIAITNETSGITQHQIMKWVGKQIYSPADDRAFKFLAPMIGDSAKDIGSLVPASKLNKILYSFGIYNIEDRFKNSQYNSTYRLMPEASFSLMAMGNFTLQSRVALTKLMEIRLIDGKFRTWREFNMDEKKANPNQSHKETRAKFDQYAEKSAFDYLNDDGGFDTERLEKDGYTGDLKKDKSRMMSQIQDVGEQVTMEIKAHNEGQGARDPLWSFALSLKKWLILANTAMFSKKRIDIETGGEEEGLMYSYQYLVDLIRAGLKDNNDFVGAYNNLKEYQQKNLKTMSALSATMVVLFALAFMLKKMADDDEKDNYALQLASYMMLRNLNETFSSNIGVGNSVYEALQSPIMLASTVGNTPSILKLGDIGQDVTKGKYKGMDKYLSHWVKLTAAKNIYSLKSAEALGETRKGYEYFTAKNALYHIFDLMPKEDKDDK